MASNSKRICVCSAQIPFRWGGAEILAGTLSAELKQHGFQVELIQIPFKWYPKEEIIKSAFAWRLIDLTDTFGEKIDLVIGTKFPSYVVKHPNKVAWVVHQHRPAYDLYGKNPKPQDKLERDTYFNYTTDDQQIQEMIIKIDNVCLKECKTIYTISKTVSNRLQKFNGIQSEPLYPPPRTFGEFDYLKYGDYILTVGRLDTNKRFDLLVEAMRHTKSGAKCIIAGSGGLYEMLNWKIVQYGLSDKVTLTGFVDDATLGRLYADSFAVFYAPLDEDYGYVTVEAFRARKPVVTTSDAGGVLEFVENDLTGLITSTNPEDIAQKIDILYHHKSRCKDMGVAGFEKVKFIDWDYIIQKLTETIR